LGLLASTKFSNARRAPIACPARTPQMSEQNSSVKADVIETPTSYIVRFDAPGVAKSRMGITVNEDSRLLLVSLERSPWIGGGADASANPELAGLLPPCAAEIVYLHSELSDATLSRAVRLQRPGLLRFDSITATSQDGVLTVTVPRKMQSETIEERCTVRIAA
jgi:HSP20 family molecular chaperone IbpA